MVGKSVIKEARLAKKVIIEIDSLRPSKLTSKVRLKGSVYYVIWDHQIFII